jgi:uncharacterized protein YxeA
MLNKIKQIISYIFITISTLIGGFFYLKSKQLESENQELQSENNYMHIKNKTVELETELRKEAEFTNKINNNIKGEDDNEIVIADA